MTNSGTQKVIARSSVMPKGGSLAFLNSGEKMDQGAVQCFIIIIYLLMRGFSGAATV
jgi:hypothetical protein